VEGKGREGLKVEYLWWAEAYMIDFRSDQAEQEPSSLRLVALRLPSLAGGALAPKVQYEGFKSTFVVAFAFLAFCGLPVLPWLVRRKGKASAMDQDQDRAILCLQCSCMRRRRIQYDYCKSLLLSTPY
jgi:hypothetical protein